MNDLWCLIVGGRLNTKNTWTIDAALCRLDKITAHQLTSLLFTKRSFLTGCLLAERCRALVAKIHFKNLNLPSNNYPIPLLKIPCSNSKGAPMGQIDKRQNRSVSINPCWVAWQVPCLALMLIYKKVVTDYAYLNHCRRLRSWTRRILSCSNQNFKAEDPQSKH